MTRASVLLLLGACGVRAGENAVQIPSANSSQQLALPPASIEAPSPAARVFDLDAHMSCLLLDGKLHCREMLVSEKAFATEPAPSGLDNIDITSAAFGRDFGCVSTSKKQVMCYGGNHFGQLGANVRDEQHEGALVLPNIQGAVRVWAGPYTGCALLENKGISCWGKNQAGENGSDTNYLEAARELVEPHEVKGISEVREMALGWDATCAILNDKRVMCWGRSMLPDQKSRGPSNEAPAIVPSLEGITQIVANEETFCAIKDESVQCWGSVMMLAPNARYDQVITLPIAHVQRVSLGANHGCAVDAGGFVYCFGSNSSGELGVPPSGNQSYMPQAPVKVAGVPRAVDVRCGSATSCAITANDDVWCWGRFSWTNKEGPQAPTRIKIR